MLLFLCISMTWKSLEAKKEFSHWAFTLKKYPVYIVTKTAENGAKIFKINKMAKNAFSGAKKGS